MTWEKETLNRIAFLTLNRPEKRNAISLNLLADLVETVQNWDEDEKIDVIVLRARGSVFSSGIDLSDLSDFFLGQNNNTLSQKEQEERFENKIRELQEHVDVFSRLSKPIVAAIQGQCIGLAFGLISAADILLSTTSASFQIKEIDWGIVADIGSLQRLPYRIPPQFLHYYAYTGEQIQSTALHRLGWIHALFETPEDLWENASDLAEKISKKNKHTVCALKKTLNTIHRHEIHNSFLSVAHNNARLFTSPPFLATWKKNNA